MRDVVEKIGGPTMAVQSPRWEPSADRPRSITTHLLHHLLPNAVMVRVSGGCSLLL